MKDGHIIHVPAHPVDNRRGMEQELNRHAGIARISRKVNLLEEIIGRGCGVGGAPDLCAVDTGNGVVKGFKNLIPMFPVQFDGGGNSTQVEGLAQNAIVVGVGITTIQVCAPDIHAGIGS